MARKKSLLPQEDAAPEEQELDYKTIRETPIEQLVGEPDAKAEEAIKKEAEPQEEPVTETPSSDEVEIEWDPAKFEEDMTKKMGQVSEEAAKKILEQVTKTKEPEKEDDQELISPWAKEGRTPKDYEEIADWALEKKSILDARAQKAAERAKAQEQANIEESNKTQVNQYNQYVDQQIAELIEAGKLPAVENSLNSNDPGIVARKALFQKMLDVNIERQKAGKQPVYSVKEIYYEHMQNSTPAQEEEEAPGADAPVSPGRSAPQVETKEVDYNDIHKKSFFDILMGK